MIVESSVQPSDQDEEVTTDELLAMFKEQQGVIEHLEQQRQEDRERINELESELDAERAQREELEATLESLERFLGPAFAKLVNTINEQDDLNSADAPNWSDVDIIPAAADAGETIQERGERLESVEDSVRRHESEIKDSHSLSADSQAEHWSRVVEKAQNVQGMSKHTLPDDWVILFKEDIAAAIEPGPKRASQLIDEWTDGTNEEKYKQGTEKQPYKPPANARNNKPQKKGIKIDLGVWGDDDA